MAKNVLFSFNFQTKQKMFFFSAKKVKIIHPIFLLSANQTKMNKIFAILLLICPIYCAKLYPLNGPSDWIGDINIISENSPKNFSCKYLNFDEKPMIIVEPKIGNKEQRKYELKYKIPKIDNLNYDKPFEIGMEFYSTYYHFATLHLSTKICIGDIMVYCYDFTNKLAELSCNNNTGWQNIDPPLKYYFSEFHDTFITILISTSSCSINNPCDYSLVLRNLTISTQNNYVISAKDAKNNGSSVGYIIVMTISVALILVIILICVFNKCREISTMDRLEFDD